MDIRVILTNTHSDLNATTVFDCGVLDSLMLTCTLSCQTMWKYLSPGSQSDTHSQKDNVGEKPVRQNLHMKGVLFFFAFNKAPM